MGFWTIVSAVLVAEAITGAALIIVLWFLGKRVDKDLDKIHEDTQRYFEKEFTHEHNH